MERFRKIQYINKMITRFKIFENDKMFGTDKEINDRLIYHINNYDDDKIDFITEDRFKIIKRYLESGVDINIKNDKGYTPFTIAAKTNKLKVFDLLCEYNPSKETVSDTFNNLAFFIWFSGDYQNSRDMIFYILEKGLDFDIIQTRHLEHTFPFYLRDNDFVKFKNEYPERYEEYLVFEDLNKFNI